MATFRQKALKEVIVLCCWIAFGCIVGYYIYVSAEKLDTYDGSPGVSLTYVHEEPIFYPSVTICNWNVGDSCSNCGLELKSCEIFAPGDHENYQDVKNCEFPIRQVNLTQQGGSYICYRFNDNEKDQLVANRTGYLGTISLIFRIPIRWDEVETMETTSVQISFHPIGQEPDLDAEIKSARPTFDNVFTIRKVIKNEINPEKTTIFWETEYSPLMRVKPANQSKNEFEELVEISFAYSGLSVKQYDESPIIEFWGFLGNVFGIVGLFLGIDLLKFLRIVLMGIRVFNNKKTGDDLFEALN